MAIIGSVPHNRNHTLGVYKGYIAIHMSLVRKSKCHCYEATVDVKSH